MIYFGNVQWAVITCKGKISANHIIELVSKIIYKYFIVITKFYLASLLLDKNK